MAPHSNIHAWEMPWTEKPGRLQSMGSQESDMTEHACTLELHICVIPQTLNEQILVGRYSALCYRMWET